MINIRYSGRFGNNLFQYFLGKILAKELDLQLLSFRGQLMNYIESDITIGKVITNPTYTIDDSIDVTEIINNYKDFGIYLNGYFQQSKYYVPYREDIKKWFKIKEQFVSDFKPSPKSIGIHIRRSDFGWSQNAGMLPLSYYTNILDSLEFDNVYIFGGTSHNEEQSDIDQLVKDTFKKYRPIYPNLRSITEFQMLMKFRRIIQSTSTFMWWASFLSDEAENIYTPVTIGGGYWDLDNKLINLRVDSSRYIYNYNIKVEKW